MDTTHCYDFLAPTPSADELGRLGDYRVLRVLGRGGMGVVFEAEDVQLKRHVALKAMISGDQSARKRFLREAQAAAAVEHDHIVPIYQVGEERGVPFIAMPLLRGETLAERLAKGSREPEGDSVQSSDPLSLAETLRIGREIALGLAAAHARGLIHRDIKPSNIWLEEESGRAKILDFGLARAADAGEELTQSGAALGTPAYMSPEQARGEHVDERADLFSLGCVLYQLATGRRPFVGRDSLSTMLAVTTVEPPAPRAVNPNLPVELDNLIVSLLCKNPSGRPQTAREVAERMAVVANGLRSVASAPAATPRSRLALMFAAAAGAALVVGVLIVIKNREGRILATAQTENGADAMLSPKSIAGVEAAPRGDANPKREREGTVAATTSAAPAGLRILDRPAAPDGAWPGDSPPPAIAPFNQVQARTHQQQWADYLHLPLEYTNSVGMKFVLIPPGEFSMGTSPDEVEQVFMAVDPADKTWQECVRSEAPAHKVALTRPFYLAVHEVTQKEYEAVVGNNPSWFAKTGADEKAQQQVAHLDTTDHPVEFVSWNDAAEFCANLSKLEEMKPFYDVRAGETVKPLKGNGYRLPTEAEWEFACRAGTTRKFWAGDNEQDLNSAGWFGNNSGGRTHKVEELTSNPFGLFDVHGNVWEWVEDLREPTFYARFGDKPAIDPKCVFSTGFQRVLRGGSWGNDASRARSAGRGYADPPDCSFYIGFRAVLLAVVPRDGG